VDMRALIAASFGAQAAYAWAKFEPSQDQLQTLASVGREVLTMFPTMPGACAMMSAVYSLRLEKLGAPAAYVFAGSLFVGDTRVFGDDGSIDWKTRFSASNPSWDGHAWIVHGNLLADISVFRTAYSKFSPPLLTAHVQQEFGKGKGLMICKMEDAVKSGLRYEPLHVLTQDEVDALGRGARAMVTGLVLLQLVPGDEVGVNPGVQKSHWANRFLKAGRECGKRLRLYFVADSESTVVMLSIPPDVSCVQRSSKLCGEALRRIEELVAGVGFEPTTSRL
jgi:hypothetical protein